MSTVDICIATFKRPGLLESLLNALIDELCNSSHSVKIIVIDNDKNKSAFDVVNEIRLNTDIDIIYGNEPIQNIALARNRAVELSDSKYIVFIDDDEWPDKNWLNSLLGAAAQYDADVVFGPVKPVFPENTPKWMIAGNYFERKSTKTGSVMPHGGTGNTLVRSSVFKDESNTFDKRYGRTGGSDTDLFSRLSNKGYKLIWCDEAVVYENVEQHRLSVKWLLYRAYRGGQVYYRIFGSKTNIINKIYGFFKRVVFIVIAAVIMIITLPFGKAVYVKSMRKMASNIGHLTGMLGGSYEEYH